jgi:hypothetical protein
LDGGDRIGYKRSTISTQFWRRRESSPPRTRGRQASRCATFSDALAIAFDAPLLFVGNDFARTDVSSTLAGQ